MTGTQPRGRRRRFTTSGVAVLGALLIGYAVLQLVGHPAGRHFEAAGTVPAAQPSTPPPADSRATAARLLTPTASSGDVVPMVDRSYTPTRLTMDRPAIDADVQPVDVLADGNLVIPDDVRTVGWWRSGAAPGSPVGTVVLAGHVDSAAAGSGAFFHLDQAPVGSRITLWGTSLDTSRSPRSQLYEVVGRRRYAKDSLPAAALFAQGPTPRLILITCGGDFDPVTRHYTDNVVVFARPVG